MGLLQILTTALQQYRQGIVFAIQQGKVYDIMLCINAMNSVLPKPARCELPRPLSRDNTRPSSMNVAQWEWANEALPKLEDTISMYLQMLQLFDLSATFVSGIQVILAFATVLATIYFISGRGSL